MRTSHDATFEFPDQAAAEEAGDAWRAAQSGRSNARAASLRRILEALGEAASLAVRREGQTVQLQVMLHDDIDVWAMDGGPTTEELWSAVRAIGTALGGTPGGAATPSTYQAPPISAAERALAQRMSEAVTNPDAELVWLPDTYGQQSFGIRGGSLRMSDVKLGAFIDGLREAGGLPGVADDAIRAALANENTHGDSRSDVDLPTLSYHVLLLDPRCEPAAPVGYHDDHALWATRVLALAGIEPSGVESAFDRAAGFTVDVTLGDQVHRLTHGRESLHDVESRVSVVRGLNQIAESRGRSPVYTVLTLTGCDHLVVAYLPTEERGPLSSVGVVEAQTAP